MLVDLLQELSHLRNLTLRDARLGWGLTWSRIEWQLLIQGVVKGPSHLHDRNMPLRPLRLWPQAVSQLVSLHLWELAGSSTCAAR